MGIDRGFRWDGTLSVEFIDLPDGTQVTKHYDTAGIRTIEEKYYRKDGTLRLRKQYDNKGQWITIKYDNTGKNPIEQIPPSDEVKVVVKSIKQVPPSNEVKEFVKSAELLSKKGLKHQKLSIQKQKGE